MKRALAVWGLLWAAAAAWGQPKKAELKIDVFEWDNDTVLIEAKAWDNTQWNDTLRAKNGRLVWRVEAQSPATVRAMPFGVRERSRSIETLVLPASRQKIEGWITPEGLLDYVAKGTDPYFADAADLRSKLLPYLAKLDAKRTKATLELMDSVRLAYLKTHRNRQIAGELLSAARTMDAFFDYAAMLTPKVRQGLFKEQLDRLIEQEEGFRQVQRSKETVVEGAQAPAVALPDTAGVVQSLDSLRGRWVVVDFWGSWCSWCLKGIPEMKKAYEQHAGKVEFLGVACNDKGEAWRRAIEKYNLPWINVFEADKGPASSAARWGVDGFPTKFVVDPQGKIALKMVGEDPKFYSELEKLLKP